MLRWSILIATFALWLACMALVYVHCKPQMQKQRSPDETSTLETIFAEDAELERGWRVFVDSQKLKSSFASGNTKPASVLMLWNGTSETNLTEIGWLKTTIKKKTPDATRVEQFTDAEFQIPSDVLAYMIPMLRGSASSAIKLPISIHTRADISLDLGLETYDSLMSLGLGGIKAHSHGVRDGDTLTVLQQVFQEQTKLLEQQQKLPVGAKDAPTLEMFPFQTTTVDVRPGQEWSISMLDSNSIDLTGSSAPHVTSTKVKCTGKQYILYDGKRSPAFEVRTEDNQARAWYSADGVVLKQTCRLFDAIEVMVVRIDPRKLKTFKFEVPAENTGSATLPVGTPPASGKVQDANK